MKFTLTIELGNDAMQTAEDVYQAIDEALFGGASIKPLEPGETGAVVDSNGNTVGQWEVRDAPVRLTNAQRYGRDGSRALRLDPDALAAAE